VPFLQTEAANMVLASWTPGEKETGHLDLDSEGWYGSVWRLDKDCANDGYVFTTQEKMDQSRACHL
jgi:hypothetical protein